MRLDGYECAILQLSLQLAQRPNNLFPNSFRSQLFCPNLNHTRLLAMGRGEYGGEVQIMCEHNIVMGCGVSQDLEIRRITGPNLRPVRRFNGCFF